MAQEHFAPDEVEEYLARIHYTGPIEPTIEALTALQRCHILSVPFENLSVFGKEKIILSKNWLFDKIVRRHRGGFCYEVNRMFSLLLVHFGFKHKLHAASVFNYKTGSLSPPSHVVLAIDIEGDVWLSDVGFGYLSSPPLRLSGLLEGQVQQSGSDRIRKHGDQYIFEERIKIVLDEFGCEEGAKKLFSCEDNPGWVPRYKFDLVPKTIHDFHDMLLFHQTDPRSPFTHDRICTVAKPWGRITLSGNKLVTSTYLPDNRVKKTRKLLNGEKEVVKELEQKFGIRREACLYPEGSIFYGVEWNKTSL
ncbi:hypothetical protein ACROYT_G019793 [Oculina patagonica]